MSAMANGPCISMLMIGAQCLVFGVWCSGFIVCYLVLGVVLGVCYLLLVACGFWIFSGHPMDCI